MPQGTPEARFDLPWPMRDVVGKRAGKIRTTNREFEINPNVKNWNDNDDEA
jgi:hypothetical protein